MKEQGMKEQGLNINNLGEVNSGSPDSLFFIGFTSQFTKLTLPKLGGFMVNKWWLVVTCIVMLLGMTLIAYAEVDVERLATAIYYAEGGTKTRHPYGILTKYKTTTPRQACINTINHALRDWDGEGDFISFLGSRYCPVGAANDPTGLNKNWIKNVKYFYNKMVDNTTLTLYNTGKRR